MKTLICHIRIKRQKYVILDGINMISSGLTQENMRICEVEYFHKSRMINYELQWLLQMVKKLITMSNSQKNMTNITRFEMFCALQVLKNLCLAPSSRDPKKEWRKREDQKREKKKKNIWIGKECYFPNRKLHANTVQIQK